MSGESTIVELKTSPHLTPNPLSDILERGHGVKLRFISPLLNKERGHGVRFFNEHDINRLEIRSPTSRS